MVKDETFEDAEWTPRFNVMRKLFALDVLMALLERADDTVSNKL